MKMPIPRLLTTLVLPSLGSAEEAPWVLSSNNWEQNPRATA